MTTFRPIPLDVAQALFPYRFTLEHVPHWANLERSDGTFYAPQYASDLEWYQNTVFPGEGHIFEDEDFCESRNPSWPLGKALTEPMRATQ